MDTKEKALNIRLSILKMLTKAGSGHTGGSMDLADIFAVLYFNILIIILITNMMKIETEWSCLLVILLRCYMPHWQRLVFSLRKSC